MGRPTRTMKNLSVPYPAFNASQSSAAKIIRPIFCLCQSWCILICHRTVSGHFHSSVRRGEGCPRRRVRTYIRDDQKPVVPAKCPFAQPGADEDPNPHSDGSEDGEEDQKAHTLVIMIHSSQLKCSICENRSVIRVRKESYPRLEYIS